MFSSRVEKSLGDFKPTIKAKRRKVEKVVEEQPRDEPTAEVVTVSEQTLPAPKIVAAPQSVPVFIQPNTQQLQKPEEVSIAAETGSRMLDLIKQKFPDGRLSAREISRREELKSRKSSSAKKDKEVKIDSPKRAQKPRTAQLITVNGEIVVDKDSLNIQGESVIEDQDEVEEDAAGRYITSASFRPKMKLVTPKWHPAMTDRFFLGMSYFGTNFKMISYMFPGLLQKHIKAKFKLEEKRNPLRITEALMARKKAPEDLKRKMLASVFHKNEQEESVYFKNQNKGSSSSKNEDLELKEFKDDETKSQLGASLNLISHEPVPEPEPEQQVVSEQAESANIIEPETEQKEPEVVLPALSVAPKVSGVRGNIVRRRKAKE